MSDQITADAVLATLARIESKVDAHGSRIDGHDDKLSAHDRLLLMLADQTAAHGKMLLEHAKLHTQHAEANIATREQARVATQSSSDLAKEWREAAAAIDKHFSKTAKEHSGQLSGLTIKLGEVIAGQDAQKKAATAAATERAAQTRALESLVKVANVRRLALVATAGAAFGGFVFGVLAPLVSKLITGH
jgi:hypothetical protein